MGVAVAVLNPGVREFRASGLVLAASVLVLAAAMVWGAPHWGSIPGPKLPQIVSIVTTASLSVDLFISLYLIATTRNSITASIVLISCAYLFLTIMGVGRLLTFPGAIVPDAPVFGRSQIGSYAYLMSRLGFGVFLVVAAGPASLKRWRARTLSTKWVATALIATSVLGIGLLECGIIAEQSLPLLVIDGHFSRADKIGSGLALAIGAVATVLLWVRRGGDRLFYAYLALTMAGFCAEIFLKQWGSAQYSLGWYLSRAVGLISTCALLAVVLKRASPQQPAAPPAPTYCQAGLVARSGPQSIDRACSPGLAKAAHVLVVDRDPDVRDALMGLLHELGLKATQAADLQAGQRLTKEIKPELVILDGSLVPPWVSVFDDVFSDRRGLTSFIIMSSPDTKLSRPVGETSGYHYIEKPIRVKQIRDLVGCLVGG